MNKINKFILILLSLLIVISCSGKEEKESILGKKKFEPNVDKRTREAAEKNPLFGKSKNSGGGSFEFATSNILWRASLDTLEFVSLSTIDYSGGVIVTDWYQSGNGEESIRITVRFLDNDLTTTSFKVLGYKKSCKENKCQTVKMSDNFSDKIKEKIISKAREIATIQEVKNKDSKLFKDK
jgi:hypothetical protein